MKLFKMGINVRIGILICHMAGEVVKKNRIEQDFIFHVYISSHCIFFSENVKEPSHFSMLESIMAQQNRNKKCKGCKDGGIYQNL